MGLVGGAAAAGKGFWEGLQSSWAHGELYAVPFTDSPAQISGIQMQGRWGCGGNCISVSKEKCLFPLAVLSQSRMKSCHKMMNEF